VLVGYGADETADRSRRRSAGPRAAPAAARGGRPLAKPPVRKLARSLGVDLSALAPGSGADGIVTRGDVMAAAAKTGGGAAGVPTAGDEVVPVRGVRARIAERMSLSRSRIPDATCAVELDFSRLLDVRRQLNEAAERAGHEPVITPLVVVCRLLVEALRAHRIFNATFVEDGPEIHIHERVHLGIGTATDRGLLVPVVRNADQLSTLQLGTRMSELAAGARAATLAPADLSGSTFTVSNFGALGLDDGVPVINHPEAAILGIGAVKPRPIAVDGAVVARPTARLTLAFDHRVCDGAEAGAFLSALRELVEYPEIALLHA
jgi:pyruvate dehydrogenase E2 component (dihydrolipoamide acetyltransferase)